MSSKIEVAVVGAGPVGLLLGRLLQQKGIDFLILERASKPHTHSKAIGIHPPSLSILNEIGVLDAFLAGGTRVEKGLAFSQTACLGEISFASLGFDFPFVLTLPQHENESILRQGLEPHIHFGCSVVESDSSSGRLIVEREKGTRQSIEAEMIVACEGHRSLLRQQAGIGFHGGAYKDVYVMGDFPDSTAWPHAASIFLEPDGVVESFPLKQGWRRWVAKVDCIEREWGAFALADVIRGRTGILVNASQAAMCSSFGVQHFLADSFYKDRLILAGDSAHVVSPIGGQGMNLGWLDVRHLADILSGLSENPQKNFLLRDYEKRRRISSQKAMFRAWMNMSLGRKGSPFWVAGRNIAVRLMLSPWLNASFAGRFTMKSL